MSFDQSTRNRLARFVSDTRRILTDEFTRQCQQEYGVDPSSGVITELGKLVHLNDTQRSTARILRETIEHYIATSPAGGARAAVERMVRAQAFTVLNRLVALRMAEAREIIIESVCKGYQSKGFQLYTRVAGASLGETGSAYECYLFSIFDELSVDLAVLFDRFSPQGCLFPNEAALVRVLEQLNSIDLDMLWVEDETVGWIYQYFNSQEERKKMREESAAPRNSRELAVRNQFFTPRYVVEFLTDNTLGRIWYEMTQGDTTLQEQCRYLVRRPTEIFLKTGDTAPEQPKQENLSQEDLLKQPVHIPHRPLKDPRTILMLDPACGSMHFGLYAFDLFEVIYDEAWALEEKLGADALSRPPGMKSLHDTYAGKDAFLKDVPRLIIEHNVHGIDIDPRCAQIAGLSLWLRAQKAWQRLGLKPAERPAIKRSNIVCAEPMPGEKELLREFVEREFPAAERAVCLRLLEAIFDKMQLAGEAGSLLKIEEEIRSAIEDARRQATTPRLFDTDVRSLNSEDFWERIEERIYAALRDYAEQAENGGGFQRRLFAEDAARGFAFIDVCRKRYDVVVMNPPFGEPSEQTVEYLERHFPTWNQNLLCAFLARGWNLLNQTGSTAAIFDRTAIVKSSYEPFRKDTLIPDSRLQLMADLGWEVLDANVEVTTCVLARSLRNSTSTFFDVRNVRSECKGAFLTDTVTAENAGNENSITTHECPTRFARLPNAVIGYDFPEFLRRAFATFNSLEAVGLKANQGFALKADKHFRVWWEIGDSKFCVVNRMFNGAGYAPYITGLFDCIVSGVQPEDLPMDSSTRKSGIGAHRLPGVCFGKRGDYFAAHVLPRGHIFTVEGQSIPVSDPSRAMVLVGYLNTPLVRFALNKYCGQHKYSGYVNLLPFVEPSGLAAGIQAVQAVFRASVAARRFDEIQSFFVAIPRGDSAASIAEQFSNTIEAACALARDCEQLFQRDIADRMDMSPEEVELIQKFSEQQPEPEAAIEDIGQSTAVDAFSSRSILSYVLGVGVGRWDIRYSTGEQAAPELPDPFAPLPVCPPGQLQNAQGLPARPEDVPAAYPVRIPWDGILVDDPNHPLDIERRVREVIEIIWSGKEGGSTAEAIEHEACEILGAKSLRDYFRKPAGFFADHLKRYSKSRRQAPIYWPLSTASGSYTLWLYYHRLTDQTLFTAINDFIEPKLKQVSLDSSRLRGKANRSMADDKSLEELIDLEMELKELSDELLRIAGFWKPNLNDGVLITAAPLWRLFKLKPWQKKLKETWEELEAGDYDWAHMALTIAPDRVRLKCKTDKSIAIAHGLEDLYLDLAGAVAKKKPRKIKAAGPMLGDEID